MVVALHGKNYRPIFYPSLKCIKAGGKKGWFFFRLEFYMRWNLSHLLDYSLGGEGTDGPEPTEEAMNIRESHWNIEMETKRRQLVADIFQSNNCCFFLQFYTTQIKHEKTQHTQQQKRREKRFDNHCLFSQTSISFNSYKRKINGGFCASEKRRALKSPLWRFLTLAIKSKFRRHWWVSKSDRSTQVIFHRNYKV